MALWWNKKLEMTGGVLFRGELPPKPEDFSYLEKLGITMKTSPGNSRNFWTMDLAHPEWGSATLACNPEVPIPPREVYIFSHLSDSDKDAAISARGMLGLFTQSRHAHILRDRKLMLHFLRAVMGDDGVAVVDFQCHHVWAREDLDDELSHDADLDVDGIVKTHAITGEDDKVYWAHTHGLAEIGGFDFDIVDPSEDTLFGLQDLSRSIAFRVMEGTLKQSMTEFALMGAEHKASLVPMPEFLAGTTAQMRDKMLDQVDESHIHNRSVICEPQRSSFIRNLLGVSGGTYQPSSLLSRNVPENATLPFSYDATNLMAERARKTYPMLRKIRKELAEFEFPCLIKIGLLVDGATEGEREHMWFEAHELNDCSIDATLCNQPYYISRLKEGDRGEYDVDGITDWNVFTPLGVINPRFTRPARAILENKEAVREAMKQTER